MASSQPINHSKLATLVDQLRSIILLINLDLLLGIKVGSKSNQNLSNQFKALIIGVKTIMDNAKSEGKTKPKKINYAFLTNYECKNCNQRVVTMLPANPFYTCWLCVKPMEIIYHKVNQFSPIFKPFSERKTPSQN